MPPWAGAAALREKCEVVHRRFLKRCAGVAQSAPNDVIYGEFGRPPLQVFWLELMARYLKRLEGAACGSLLACAFSESRALTDAGHSSWVGSAGEQLAAAAAQPWMDGWRRRITSDTGSSKIRAYRALKSAWGQESYLSAADVPRQHRVAMARLRMGCHWLGSQLGIYAETAERQRERKIRCVHCLSPESTEPNVMLLCDQCNAGWHLLCLSGIHALDSVPDGHWFCPSCTAAGGCTAVVSAARAARVCAAAKCPFCGEREDEWHALFSCGLYNSIRDAHPDLFSCPQSTSLCRFFTENKAAQLCKFVYLCYRRRQALQ